MMSMKSRSCPSPLLGIATRVSECVVRGRQLSVLSRALLHGVPLGRMALCELGLTLRVRTFVVCL